MLAACLFAGCAVGPSPVERGLPDLTAHRWRHRVLVIDTPSRQEEPYLRQRAALESVIVGLEERDLQVVTQEGQGFRLRLIGKDGGVKLDQAEPIEASALFALIDAMPMRRAEMSAR